LAKEVATLDYLSGGRIELGIGVGWLKEEFEALGIPFERRGKRADEYVSVMRALWASDRASFAGEFVKFDKVNCNPKPVAKSVPIVVGAIRKRPPAAPAAWATASSPRSVPSSTRCRCSTSCAVRPSRPAAIRRWWN
jgi:alkanesulfonate monooxygenase SsuD/methylene tetrahydromethanopterin reductase-like flavin-dependent oxidoreductase (luciferase family)